MVADEGGKGEEQRTATGLDHQGGEAADREHQGSGTEDDHDDCHHGQHGAGGEPGAQAATSWMPDPTLAPAAFWDELYRAKPQVWSGNVNPVLAAEVADLAPGTVLDLGCGEGGDAVWFAERGWSVTAADIAEVALERGRARAAELGLGDRIDFQRHDFAESFPVGEFDLVSAQFLQSPLDLAWQPILRRAAAAVAPGGTIVVVSHAEFPPWAERADQDHRFATPEEQLEAMAIDPAAWDVVRCEVAERWADDHHGHSGTLRDAVVVASRRP